MTGDLTAGEFATMTGLSAKALRLYAERGILTPASVDPVSGYRSYARSQLRHGITTDLLRRAQVPLAELVAASDFDFEDWRGTVDLRRGLEDFYLAVAELVSAFDPAGFVAHSVPAGAADWVGAVVDLDIPDDVEAKVESFAALAVDVPAVLTALDEALVGVGVEPAESFWTGVPDSAARNGAGQMLLALPVPDSLAPAVRAHLAARVRADTGRDLAVIGG
ncbi:MerR family DNA-binding transcriptional regulator, partial [Glycomyces tenuis]